MRSAQYQSTVGLIRALGGGWDVPLHSRAAQPQALAVVQAAN